MGNCVITSAVRTAVGAYLGSLKTVEAPKLLSPVISAAIQRSGIEKTDVGELIMGEVYGYFPNVARSAALLAGVPEQVPAFTVDRQCASSLQAVITASHQIAAGACEMIVAGGVETMSRMLYYLPPSARYEGFRLGNSQIYDAFSHGVTIVQPPELYPNLNMGLTAENLAEIYHISRVEQDEFALNSQMKMAEALAKGKFQDEILPIEVQLRKSCFVFDSDEHIKKDCSMDFLSTLQPAFKKGGTVTAGNASGMNDGASAVVMMDEDTAIKRGISPLVRILESVTVGVDPSMMGIGPAPAIEQVLQKRGLSLADIDLIEINEAFAAQSIAVLRALDIQIGSQLYKKVNVNGGAIAHGHALGNSGTRILTTLIYELRRRSARYGIASLCIGGGMGTAILIENCF